MKRKPIKPRNPLVAATMFRKAGAHGKAYKAVRRKNKADLQREAGVVAAHRTFTPGQDGFAPPAPTESFAQDSGCGSATHALRNPASPLASHQATNAWRLFGHAACPSRQPFVVPV